MTQKNQILDIEEIIFSELAAAVADGHGPDVTDALLDALRQARSGELTDIVSTIQRAQYEVISRDLDQLLIVQGGPGTGKTVVGLHRISWLLYNRRDALASNDVLVVGPNRAFIRYISSVLPSLGDVAVVQRPVPALGPTVRTGRIESAAIRRLKGDNRMVEVLRQGLANRQDVTEGPIEFTIEGRRVRLAGSDLVAFVRARGVRPHNEIYSSLREEIIRSARASVERLGVRDIAAFDVNTRGDAIREVDNYLERAWPNLTPQAFVLELFSTRRQLAASADGILSSEEIDLLGIPRDTRIGAWQWSDDDIAVLDAADELLNGSTATYSHIVVDEAQDLSPMQLRSIRRRSRTGWMTVLGDLAQATSPWAHESWDDVAELLGRPGVDVDVAELQHGYRLPIEVHRLAMRLLPHIAPTLDAPEAVRLSGHDPAYRRTEEGDLVGATVTAARELLGTGLIGIIVPVALRPDVGRQLSLEELVWAPELQPASAPIVLLTAEDAKGLEFDNVVVVEPALIVAEAERGLRALFVALTRCTRRLAIVYSRPWPNELGSAEEGSPEPPVEGPASEESAQSRGQKAPGHTGPPTSRPGPALRISDLDRQIAASIAKTLVEHARNSVQPEILPIVAEEFARLVAAADDDS